MDRISAACYAGRQKCKKTPGRAAMTVASKIRAILLGAAVGLLAAPMPLAASTDYPTRPVQVIVPLAAGGPGDILMRVVAEKMGELLGQRVIIDNRPGAGSNVGFGAAARAPADGYTLLLGLAPLSINPSLFKSVPYDPIKDFVP